MTSLPISIPHGYAILVKKGDSVAAGQVLAKGSTSVADESPTSSPQPEDSLIDVAQALDVVPYPARKYVQKGPGDIVQVGEVIAEKGTAFGFKKERLISNVSGTVVKFERDTGRLLIRTSSSPEVSVPSEVKELEIVSPLAGTISVCNNDAITIESESDALVGSNGIGGSAQGKVVALSPKEGKGTITSEAITKELAESIILLPDIEKEAVAKAAVLGVAGILGTELADDLFSYAASRKITIPMIAIDSAIGKKIVKAKGILHVDGEKRSILINE